MKEHLVNIIEPRLVILQAELKKQQAIIDDNCTQEYFDTLRLFNAEKDLAERLRLCRKAQRLFNRMKTWTQRTNAAWEKKAAIEHEIEELRTELWFARRA